jgi:gamma-carbonic anhydrase
MAIFSFEGIAPKYDTSVYLAPGVQLIGKVILGPNANIWHNCVIRGDVNWITIGECTNVQDLSMLHVTSENPLVIGNNVTIGHSVTLHGCTIHDNVLVGMGATVLDRAVIGEFSIVAAGAVVPPNKTFPPYSMLMGAPAKVVRELKPEEVAMLKQHYRNYLGYAQTFKNPELVKELKPL